MFHTAHKNRNFAICQLQRQLDQTTKQTSSTNKNQKPDNQMEKPNKISRRHDGLKTDKEWTHKNYFTKSKRSQSLTLPNIEPKITDPTKDQNPTVHHLHQTNPLVRISCLGASTKPIKLAEVRGCPKHCAQNHNRSILPNYKRRNKIVSRCSIHFGNNTVCKSRIFV
ncbi:hypothetical protein QTP88_025003 [Uroleucon formosanum]